MKEMKKFSIFFEINYISVREPIREKMAEGFDKVLEEVKILEEIENKKELKKETKQLKTVEWRGNQFGE
jgi:hypothetical protein